MAKGPAGPQNAIRQWYNNCSRAAPGCISSQRSSVHALTGGMTPTAAPGTLFVVATPIGNLEDITLRALRVLREVALIAAEDTRRTAHLLARHAIRTPVTSLHEHNEARKTAALLARLSAGANIAVVSDAGTPTVSDPGRRLIAAAIDAGIRVEPIPGASAVLTALAASGIDGDAFSFLGFPPNRSNDRRLWIERLQAIGGTVVFFEAPHRILKTLAELQHELGDRTIVIGRELTKTHEELVKGPISSFLSGRLRAQGEFTVIIDVGHSPNTEAPEPIAASKLVAEFGYMTENVAATRRAAIRELARRHAMTPRQVYAAIEKAKKSGE